MDKYYEIRKRKNGQEELIIAIKDGKLELIVGNKESLNLSGAKVEEDTNKLILNSEYFYIKINEKEAQRRKQKYQ
jgi:hypothetical protein